MRPARSGRRGRAWRLAPGAAACASLLAMSGAGALHAAQRGPAAQAWLKEHPGAPPAGRQAPAVRLKMDLDLYVVPTPIALPETPRLAVDPALPRAGEGAGDGAAEGAELLGVRINQVEQAETVLALRLANGDLAVPLDAWLAWFFKRPAEPLRVEGSEYAVLGTVAGLRWQIDGASQTLAIDAPASAFARHEFGVASEVPPTRSTGLGGFLNYDLLLQRDGSAQGAPASHQASALVEAGAFGGGGYGRSTGLWRQAMGGSRFTRLDTQWTIDRPDAMSSLRFGDAIGVPGAWGRSLRFGGVQWATNFAVRPGFVSMPMPGVKGEAALPSVLDLYVNDTRQRQGSLPPGPFDLPDVPVVTGPGEVRLVVRDVLGREQVIVQPYYVSPLLLKPGLHDFALEAGAVREDYGLRSEHYGEALVTLTDRYGVSPSFTEELRAELMRRQQTLGATGVWLLGQRGTANLAAAASRSERGMGWLVGGGLDTQNSRWSANLQTRLASREFAQMGQAPLADAATPRATLSAGASTALGPGGLNVNLLLQSTWQGGRYRSLAVNYGAPVGLLGYLGLFATRTAGSASGWSFGLNLIKPLGETASASVGAYRSRDSMGYASDGGGTVSRSAQQATLQLQSSVPSGPGVAYQVLAERGDFQRFQAQAQWMNERSTLSAEAAHANGASALRLGASGGVALMPEGLFLSRRVEGSFAVVKVDDYPDVRIQRDNQPVARTDRNGLALVTGLRGFEANRIGVEAADLPLDAEVDSLEMLVAPGPRSGVSLHFPVRRIRSASLRLVAVGGETVPTGTWVRVDGGEREFPVGFDGKLFLVGLAETSRIEAAWGTRRCSALVRVPPPVAGPGADEVPELGLVLCE